MSRLTRTPLSALLLLTLLTGCTGTQEVTPPLRLAVLNAGGSSLGYLDTSPPEGKSELYFQPTLQVVEQVKDGRALHTLGIGKNLLLTRGAAIERRDLNLKTVQTFPAPGVSTFPAAQCWVKSVLNANRDRILALSQCPNDATQRVALYDVSGTLVWQASLGAYTEPTGSAPPVRLAAVGDVAVVTRASLSGGSEVIRIAPRGSGDPVRDLTAVTTTPQNTVSIRDLALSGNRIYAATDTGVYPLLETGLPDLERRVAAFGESRYDRLWGANLSTRNLLFAWRDSQTASPLFRVWDGTSTSSVEVPYVYDLRDLTLAPDGNLYLLSRSSLLRYDAVSGLQNQTWQVRTLNSSLDDARALAWLVP